VAADDLGRMVLRRDYGDLLVEVATFVPDGVVCFFTSYQYMEKVILEWERTGIIRQVRR
jgi:DNA excision repair protein ERCC-2